MYMYKWPALRLAFVPGIAEALFDAGIAKALFGMPFTLSLSMGFILKAVGPGLVVPAMFVLQKEGWGADKGACTLGFEDWGLGVAVWAGGGVGCRGAGIVLGRGIAVVPTIHHPSHHPSQHPHPTPPRCPLHHRHCSLIRRHHSNHRLFYIHKRGHCRGRQRGLADCQWPAAGAVWHRGRHHCGRDTGLHAHLEQQVQAAGGHLRSRCGGGMVY